MPGGGHSMRISTEGLARASARRPWATISLWVVAIAVAGWLSSQFLSEALTTDADFTNNPEAKQAQELIEERFGEEGVTEVFILGSDEATVEDPEFEESFRAITLEEDFSTIAEEDLAQGESFGVIVALIVLVLVFGAVVAGVIPIAMAIASISVALGITALVGRAADFSFFVTNMITMMGLAVGIDYSLFIVSRYREERFKGLEKIDAITAAGATASRAVFFSGMTVVLALIGMLIIPTTIFRSLGAGAIFVVVASVVASLTLLPALLSLLGDRVNSLRVFRRKTELGSE